MSEDTENQENEGAAPIEGEQYLNLSDDDFNKLPEPAEEVIDVADNSATIEDNSGDPGDEGEDDQDPDKDLENDSTGPDDLPDEQEQSGSSSEESDKDDETEKDTDDDKDEKDTTSDEKPDEIDYKAAYDEALAPLPANGTTIKLDSIAQLRKLASGGMNYTKKMVALKPALKLMKMLENNNLMDEQKLSYLIDLDKKNPEAIRKLMKDGNIDPLEVDLEKDTEYTPNTYTVDDSQVHLDQVLDDIRDTSGFNETMNIVGNKWDESSKQILLKNPDIITTINDHVQSGIYDLIDTQIQKERVLGNLTGLSDLDAYKRVGDMIQAKGGFDSINQTPSNKAPELKPNLPPKAPVDPKLASRRKAAAPTKNRIRKKKTIQDFNPLALSDEEFEKLSESELM